MITVQMTPEQADRLIAYCDAVVKQLGLNEARMALTLAQLLADAKAASATVVSITPV